MAPSEALLLVCSRLALACKRPAGTSRRCWREGWCWGGWYRDGATWLGREQKCKRSCSYTQPCGSKKCTVPWICCCPSAVVMKYTRFTYLHCKIVICARRSWMRRKASPNTDLAKLQLEKKEKYEIPSETSD